MSMSHLLAVDDLVRTFPLRADFAGMLKAVRDRRYGRSTA